MSRGSRRPPLRRATGLAAALATALTCAAALSGPAGAADGRVPQNPTIVPIARAGDHATLTRIRLIANKSETVRIEVPVSDVLVGSSEIADAIPVSDRSLYLLGKKEGTTNVSLFDASKRLVGVIDVVVGPDLAALREERRRRDLVLEGEVREATGASGIRVASRGDKPALVGVAADAVTVDRAMQVAPAGTANLTRVTSPQQVMLKVRFVEVNRRAGRELGVRWELHGRNGNARVGAFGQAVPISQSPGAGLLAPGNQSVNTPGRGLNPFALIAGRVATIGDSPLDLFISALEDKGLARRLAEPNLVALSGDTASFHAGGEYPIPVASTTNNGIPTITVSYREFGVRLTFTPTVLSNGAIHLNLQPEVSELDPSLVVSTGGISVPGLSKRTARTSIQLRDGQSFAIAGLLQHVSDRNIQQLPWLGSVPIIGALFSSKDFAERETELVVIVTPHLVKPAKPGQLLATPLETSMPPNDLDFFASGKLELRRNMREFVTKEGAAIGPHGHLLPAVVGDQMAPN